MSAATSSGLIELDAADVAEMLESGEAVLVDVRENDEWLSMRIPGAVCLPMSEADPAKWSRFDGQKVILSCQGGVRSSTVAHRLLEAGHEQVIHLKGGLNAWVNAGLPIASGI